MQKNILITGGAGFIGSNLAEALLADERVDKVRVLDNLSNGHLKNITPFLDRPDFEFIEGDIRDMDTCLQACAGMDLVSHQAALGSVPRSIKDPHTSNAVNIAGTLNIFKAAEESGINKVVFAASSSTYGDSRALPKREGVIGKPISPYAVTKLVCELYADVFSNLYDFNYIGLRYFNVFGPKQDPNGPYAAVIPLFVKAIMEGKPPLIHGDGLQSRDFTFVGNAVEANIRSLFATREDAWNEVYNVAVGERTTILELFQLLKEVSGSDLEPTFGPTRQGDVKHSLADISKAKNYLGYDPQYSIKEGLKIAFEWYKKQYTAKTI
ncbi:MAG: SDR family oxidoreductase [Cyanothece sp. SIO1E1]|nr:SDR family oxidoreductase [Cyanothece sp. SIO1E1]